VTTSTLRAAASLAGLGFALSGCGDGSPDDLEPAEPASRISVLARGAGISGANGLHFSPDGLLYVASVLGSELVVLDPDSGEVRQRLTAADGVVGPDDVAFAPDGSFYWTSILTGEVAGFDAAGERVVAANLTPGVNPITFAPDGRLFVAQCFFGDGLYELDPQGRREPRAIATDLGPGCGLNGMDWGPDGRLYGPRWFHGEVVSFDVNTGERRLEVDGLQVPAAVKFDSRGRLHVLDTAAGQVLRVAGEDREVVAELMPGLDNFAFDRTDRLFVSSFTDGAVWRVESDGRLAELSPGGMAHPGGVAVLEPEDGQPVVVVADLHALRGFDPETGEAVFTERNVLGFGELGSVTAVAADGGNLILTAFTEDDVRIWDPAAARVVERHERLQQPVSAIRYGTMLAVAEHGTGRVVGLADGAVVPLATDLPAPTGLASDGERLFVSDRERGEIIEIARAGEPITPRVAASGLDAPEGIAWTARGLVVVEGESGRVLEVTDAGETRLLAIVAPGTPPVSAAEPPSMVLNGVAVLGNTLVVTGETNRVLYRFELPPAATDSSGLTE
jgi:sugar lactone lactonase YvrE